jgi:hypothetical protein
MRSSVREAQRDKAELLAGSCVNGWDGAVQSPVRMCVLVRGLRERGVVRLRNRRITALARFLSIHRNFDCPSFSRLRAHHTRRVEKHQA